LEAFLCWQQIQDADMSNAEEPDTDKKKKDISNDLKVSAEEPSASNHLDGRSTQDKEVLLLSYMILLFASGSF
jgi:hypothetical protein